MATEGGRISPPSRRGGSRPPPVARSIFFFFSPEGRRRWAAGGGGWRRPSPEVDIGLFIWLLNFLIECFDFIFNLCIFLKLLRCQSLNGGQKNPSFYHDRMAAAPIYI
jgi:hypothetical protein